MARDIFFHSNVMLILIHDSYSYIYWNLRHFQRASSFYVSTAFTIKIAFQVIFNKIFKTNNKKKFERAVL